VGNSQKHVKIGRVPQCESRSLQGSNNKMRRKGSQLSSLLCLLIVGLGLTTIVSLLIYSAFVADEESFMERDYRRGLEDAAASTNSSKTGTDLSSTTTTSACLYIMDDNHFLIGKSNANHLIEKY